MQTRIYKVYNSKEEVMKCLNESKSKEEIVWKKFNLSHVVLYSKNWYKKSNNRNDDLMRCLVGDGYYYPCNLFSVLVHKFTEFNEYLKENHPEKYFSLERFIFQNESCLRRETNDFETIIIDKILEILRFFEYKKIGFKLERPDYKNVLPYNKTKNGMTNKEIERLTNKYDWYGK